ncbi:MAG: hypothetical protein WC022_00520 [Parcubacteria group bacterium]
MAKSKKQVEAISSGMGVFVTIISGLVELVKSFGGSIEDLYYLGTPEGRQKLEAVARVIVEKAKEEKLKPKSIERFRIINETTIMVNLDAPLILPFNGAEIEFQIGSGWVKVEKRTDGLYVDGCKVILHLVERQKGGKVIKGYELREELSGKRVLHPNIMDALFENQYMIPADWKKDESGNIRFIFFWAVIFRRAVGKLYVRCFYFSDGEWFRGFRWLGDDWGSFSPAALLAS